MPDRTWLVYAILSALCAAFVGIFGKIGMKGVDPTLATAVRSVIMTIALAGLCSALGVWGKAAGVGGRAWGMIALSGVAGAASWLFYFRALQLGDVAKVAPIDKLSLPITVVLAAILLRERLSVANWIGVAIMMAGAFLASRQST